MWGVPGRAVRCGERRGSGGIPAGGEKGGGHGKRREGGEGGGESGVGQAARGKRVARATGQGGREGGREGGKWRGVWIWMRQVAADAWFAASVRRELKVLVQEERLRKGEAPEFKPDVLRFAPVSGAIGRADDESTRLATAAARVDAQVARGELGKDVVPGTEAYRLAVLREAGIAEDSVARVLGNYSERKRRELSPRARAERPIVESEEVGWFAGRLPDEKRFARQLSEEAKFASAFAQSSGGVGPFCRGAQRGGPATSSGAASGGAKK